MNSCGCLYVFIFRDTNRHKNLTGETWLRVPSYHNTMIMLWKARDGWSAGLSSDDNHAQVSTIKMYNSSGDERKGAPRGGAKDRRAKRIT